MRPQRAARPRVVVTGLGCVTPLGGDLASTWASAVAGVSGVGAITRFDASQLPVQIAAEVRAPVEVPGLNPKEARRLDRFILLGLAAAEEAWHDSGLAGSGVELDRAGVAIGSGIGGLATILENHRILLTSGARRVSPFTIPMTISNMASGYVSMRHGLRGPNLCHVSACSTGSHSIGEAARLIERGDADVMLAGGAEAPLTEIAVAGFAAMRALSTRSDDPERASRPFDVGRDGFVMAEGAGVLVLESLEHARARGARIRAEVAGYAATADAAHMTLPDETGSGAQRCMRLALADADLPAEAVDHVNAHATSTPAGDPAEARAIRAVFGDHTDRLPVSATKSMTGHLLGAAGAVEALLCIRALEAQLLPPTINLDQPDPECPLDHVVGKARRCAVRVTLSNSFGFGGTNASLVLTRWEE
ncbi:MAG TPA: beta-ketoacyl-ACP synthase II [Myxococcota bacterium]|nr:beta-ketoacyl-ACP synthase II [Myxococcota bacterium]